ncbi:hypothetical protein LMTR3_20700 [Bradyrhizobium sp. LMTR 3]|nr:hypothetical protein LMTR3_20700 [Bradyrhizobium sp. LMTR 3]
MGGPNSIIWQAEENSSSAFDPSIVREAQHLTKSNMAENLRLANSMAAQLNQGLPPSETDRAAGLNAHS